MNGQRPVRVVKRATSNPLSDVLLIGIVVVVAIILCGALIWIIGISNITQILVPPESVVQGNLQITATTSTEGQVSDIFAAPSITLAALPTNLPLATSTPYPTNTPQPTNTPFLTYTPHPTTTSYPTYTPLPTLPPYFTYTPAPTPTLAPTMPVLVRALYHATPHLYGDDVLTLQTRLLALGYSEVGTLDGYFGPLTESAVLRFQRNNGLVEDGIVGPITWKALWSSTAVRGD